MDTISKDFVIRSASPASNLTYYLCALLPPESLKRVWGEYAIGATKSGGTIFWQIDANGKVRTGKIMQYDPASGHKVAQDNGGKKYASWVHGELKRRGAIPKTWELRQCLFGERLLTARPSDPVGMVESEKTALICAVLFPQFVWVATGGKGNLQADKLKPLQGRHVVAFPDIDATQLWERKAAEARATGVNIYIADYLERHATPAERESKADIADLLLEQCEIYAARKVTAAYQAQKDPVRLLVEKLDLTPTFPPRYAEIREAIEKAFAVSKGRSIPRPIPAASSTATDAASINPPAGDTLKWNGSDTQQGEQTARQIKKAVEYINAHGIDITASYDDWVKCAAAFAHGVGGEEGESLFLSVASQYAGYNEKECRRLYSGASRRPATRAASIGTFFHLCRQNGVPFLIEYTDEEKRAWAQQRYTDEQRKEWGRRQRAREQNGNRPPMFAPVTPSARPADPRRETPAQAFADIDESDL